MDIHGVRDTKNSFKKLCKACVPSAAQAETEPQQQAAPTGTSSLGQHTSSLSTPFVNNKGPKSTANFRRSSQKKFTRLNNGLIGSNQFNTSINYNHSLTGSSQQYTATDSNKLSSSTFGFHKLLNDSKWFEQLQVIINVSNLVFDRMEEAASVIVALEEGWDLTAQVASVAQLILDPYYRTLEGFSVLIEREWLSMGHRFTRRNNHTVDDQTGFAPVFIQFLDVVHQCLNQFPNAFEFNVFYLEFLAYHSVSNRFKTFLLDSEFERVNFGLLSFAADVQKRAPAGSSASPKKMSELHTHVSFSQSASISANTTCIWEYISKVHYNSAKFFNFNYQPNMWQSIKPSSNMFKLKLWRYYTKETLCTGPVYDLDLINIGKRKFFI